MTTIDINQALPKITELLEIASKGGEIIITKDDQYWVKLVSVNQSETNQLLNKNFEESLDKIINNTTENDDKLTPQERVQNWLDFIETLPKTSTNLPDSALHRDSIYEDEY
jgi:antitoxin (DNA-binding transcriptional repressor) of toxin-antitoxin stability system